jgi:hypothetical protein
MSLRWAALLIVILVVAPSTAFAHVNRFADASRYPVRADLIFSGSTGLWLGASAVVLLWASLVQRVLGGADWPRLRIWHHLAAGGPTQLAVLAAIGLVSAAVHPALFAPNLSLPSTSFGLGLAALELAVAASFVTGVLDWLGALLLIGLVGASAVVFSPTDLAEQIHWVGLALVVLCVGRTASHGSTGRAWLQRFDPDCASRALAVLRILTGASVVAAACDEKLWNPALGRAFMAAHPLFNVLHGAVGPPLSDDTFVLLIGVAEGTLGVLLASGLLTRVVVLGMWLPFNLGIPFLPPQELLGHLPIFGAMYLLLAHGPGQLVNWQWVRSQISIWLRLASSAPAAVALPGARSLSHVSQQLGGSICRDGHLRVGYGGSDLLLAPRSWPGSRSTH